MVSRKETIAVEQRQKNYWIFFGTIWAFSVVMMICIYCYNDYLSHTYLKGKSLNLVNALQIVNDPYYFLWFFAGLVNIVALVGAVVYLFTKELNRRVKVKQGILWIAPLISLLLLVILLVIYSNPILMAFFLVILVGGTFIFISSSNY